MPPKQAKAGGRNKEEQEESLQAVVIADSFETKFAPFSLERPRCLVPLANTPLIEYTLEYLAISGVQEVFFYAGAHIEQVETYLKASKWMSPTSPFKTLELLRCMATSVGDIMRDLDQKQLMNGDFICISGDVVSDFPIHKAMKEHKSRREADKNAIMTMCLREKANSEHRHSRQVVQTFVIDPAKDRCLHYEESLAGSSFGLQIDPEMLKSAELDLRQDLVDCRIDICTPDVLSLWSDNFDNQKPRKDFLFGVLKDYELNGKTIHTYIIEDHYANRVENPAAYATITRDLQSGIASGLLLTNNVSGTKFKRLRGDVAREDSVIIQKPTRLRHGTIVGGGSSIGASTELVKTVIGRRCQIGRRTTVESAFIWDDVTIGSDVKVTRAIIGSEVYIGDKCVIDEGALISFGANIPAGTHVHAGRRITSASTFGAHGPIEEATDEAAYDSDEEEIAQYDTTWANSFYQVPEYAASNSSIASDASDLSEELSREGSRSQSFATINSEGDEEDRFIHDTAAILAQRMKEDTSAENMQDELMGLRFSGGGDSTLVSRAVATALSKHINTLVADGEKPQVVCDQQVTAYRNLIWRPNTEMTREDQVVFLLEIQRDMSKRPEGAKTMPWFLMTLFQENIFEEATFRSWFGDSRAAAEDVIDLQKGSQQFIDYLDKEEETDSEDEDEDDSEESD